MIKPKISSVFSFLLFVLFPFFGWTQQLDNQVVESIDVILHPSTEPVEDNRFVLSRMTTQEEGIFSQSDFDEDLKTLSTDYDRVEPIVESVDDKIHITLHLWPKPMIRSIKWNGHDKVLVRRLQKELGIKAFTEFEKEAFNTAFHKLKAYYIRKGFFEAEIDYQVIPIPDTNEVDILIDIKEGRSGKIQEIIFVNFTDREQSELLKEMATKKYNLFMSWYTQEGVYNQDAIDQDQLVITNYLQNEGYADARVSIDVIETTKENRIVLNITADKGELTLLGLSRLKEIKFLMIPSLIVCSEYTQAILIP